MRIALVGTGMGNPGTMTAEARNALGAAEIVIGSERLLAGLPEGIAGGKIPLAVPEKVAEAIHSHPEWNNVCVALSGDVGFYSGAKKLLPLLRGHQVELVPGISTPQYFAARLRRPWQDFRLISAHGVRCDALAETLNHPAVLFLTGGDITPAAIAAELRDAGLDDALMTVGENLSYPEERIVSGAPGELAALEFAPLSVVLVENGRTFSRDGCCPGIEDEAFVRGKAPMTKREIRAVALSLLRPKADSVLYDIGAGTGSVAVEMALQARRGRVYAVESDADAFELLKNNRAAFGAYNARPVFGAAPEALAPLPAPDAAFIGGSRGRLRAIIEAVLAKNAHARLVVAAIALETLSLAMESMKELRVGNVEVCQVAANRAAARGGYHMLEARNPVFLIAGGGA